MAIKDILVHLTDDCEARVSSAIALAQAHDAHLTGLYPVSIPTMPNYVKAQIGDDVLQRQRDIYMERARAAEHQFSSAAQTAGIPFEARCVEGQSIELLCLHSRYCDLLILDRLCGDEVEESTYLAETLILESGKPVMLIPKEGMRAPPADHIAVAWNASREAARAVDAALPLLCAAKQVNILEVDPATAHDSSLPAADIGTHLARHGVNVRAEGLASNGNNVGEVLLARALTDGADLLVMGAYGHARWREQILGGATAHVLANSKMAVLLAH